MSDFTFLLKEVERLRSAGQTFAVGTVVHIAGSTYRQAGGRMLVRVDLSTWGLISGGCLEEETRLRWRRCCRPAARLCNPTT